MGRGPSLFGPHDHPIIRGDVALQQWLRLVPDALSEEHARLVLHWPVIGSHRHDVQGSRELVPVVSRDAVEPAGRESPGGRASCWRTRGRLASARISSAVPHVFTPVSICSAEAHLSAPRTVYPARCAAKVEQPAHDLHCLGCVDCPRIGRAPQEAPGALHSTGPAVVGRFRLESTQLPHYPRSPVFIFEHARCRYVRAGVTGDRDARRQQRTAELGVP